MAPPLSMPPEWTPHERTLMCWPARADMWGDLLGAAEASHAEVANAIAAFLLYLERSTGKLPHVYFHWTEGNPMGNLLRFMVLGEGDVAPLVHEVLRRTVADPRHRPVVHVS